MADNHTVAVTARIPKDVDKTMRRIIREKRKRSPKAKITRSSFVSAAVQYSVIRTVEELKLVDRVNGGEVGR